MLAVLTTGFLVWALNVWRFETLTEYRWEDASESWTHRIGLPVNTDYPFACADGSLGRSDHTIRFLNRPERGGAPLRLVIEDGARDDRIVYKGDFRETIVLKGIQYCDRDAEGGTVRTYEQAVDPESGLHFANLHFIIFDPATGTLVRAFAEAPSPVYSAAVATVELYPFVREDVLGRYALRIDTPFHPLPDWYKNPRLYSDLR